MILNDLIFRREPAPWTEGDNIPWNEPEFSQAMLKEHLSQSHNAASRRSTVIDQQVRFIHARILGSQYSQILDLGCGPGLYLERLAHLGHVGVGIDFSPASIAYAQERARQDNLPVAYQLCDLRSADFGSGYDLVMLLYGEFNVFRPSQAALLLRKAWAALKPGGHLLLEPSPEAHIRHLGQAAPSWYTSTGGLFSPRPHLMLEEASWDEAQQATTTRYYRIDTANGQMICYAASYQAYSDEGYHKILGECGFDEIQFFPSLTGSAAPAEDLFVILGTRR